MKYIFGFLFKCVYTIFYLLHVGIQILWNLSLDVDYRVLALTFKGHGDEFGWYSTDILTFWRGETLHSEELANVQKQQHEECY